MIAGAANNDQTPFFTAPGWSNTDPNIRYIWIGAIIEPGSTVGHSNIVLDSETAFNDNQNGITPEPGTLGMLAPDCCRSRLSCGSAFSTANQSNLGRRQRRHPPRSGRRLSPKASGNLSSVSRAKRVAAKTPTR